MNKFSFVLFGIFVLCLAACGTHKTNTATSRWWQAFNTRYNVYYNGAQAYIEGSLEKEQGNKDNYTEMLPLYTVGNKNSKELGKGNFDKAIEKAKKAIQLHSIKKRPVWDKSRRKTEKDIEWLNRREYNPFMWKVWMLMGRSQFHEGAFEDAASTFAYMSRLYATQPAIYGRARAWLAKCYIEQGWLYDAEDVIRNMQRDSIDWRARKEWDYTLADYYVHTGEYAKAVPYLQKVIRHEMRHRQKAREYYLLGQVLAALNRRQEAYSAFRHVIRMNPPYELEFNARISMTEVLAKGQSKKMIGKLKRMARSDKNKDYLDQVYYAIGNIYLADKDTLQAINAYEQGNKKATQSGIEKGVLLLHLGDLYWAKEKYGDARRCYDEAIGLLDKDRKDYEQLSQRSKVLDKLAPYTDAVELQDSLQALAKMNEKDRNAAIDRVIEALKKKEKEEKRNQAQGEVAQREAQYGGNRMNQRNTSSNTPSASSSTGSSQTWYFYNPMTIQQGKQSFQRQWGKRENVDNWQRVNTTVVAGLQNGEMTDEMRDSLAQVVAHEDSLQQITDSAQNDPHKREYYLKQIPMTAEQMTASNKLLEDGLYNAGVIFKDDLDNLTLSEKFLRRLSDQHPDYEHMDDAYYHLYLLYMRKGDEATANSYLDKLKSDYPKSTWTVMLSDPYYFANARNGVHLEDSLYAATYDAFKADRYAEVAQNEALSKSRFPLGANRDKFLFIGGLSKLNDGDANGCIANMKEVVEKYPNSRISELAGMIVNGVKAGRRLHGGKFNLEDVWTRRSEVLNDSDKLKKAQFSVDRNANFLFMAVYNPDSINENQLLFQLAKYNFTTYLVRNFEIAIEEDGDLHRMVIRGFRSYDEAWQYAHSVYLQRPLLPLLRRTRALIISEQNLALIGSRFSYADYDKFYSRHFAAIKVRNVNLFDEPIEPTAPTKPTAPTSPTKPAEPANPRPDDTDIYFDDGFGSEPTDTPQQDTQKKKQNNNNNNDYDLEDEYYDLDGF
ncbi:tetratricopeptide repeat protein [Prevotella sp. AGR2160]|uniref:type IX secretion system periplasmic lipoprotein PorW/SprE n=1 Tax=Prevotella sp. AGR2160 TaxID=1280674 RepID=UPI000407096E